MNGVKVSRFITLNYTRKIPFQVQVHLKQCHPVVCLKRNAVFKRKLFIKQGVFCWTHGGMFIGYGDLNTPGACGISDDSYKGNSYGTGKPRQVICVYQMHTHTQGRRV